MKNSFKTSKDIFTSKLKNNFLKFSVISERAKVYGIKKV